MIQKLLKPFIHYETVILAEGKICDLIETLKPLSTYFNRFRIYLPQNEIRNETIKVPQFSTLFLGDL